MTGARTVLAVAGVGACLLGVALMVPLVWRLARGPCADLTDLSTRRVAAPYVLAVLGPVLLLCSLLPFTN